MTPALLSVLLLLTGPNGRAWRPPELAVAPTRVQDYAALERIAFRYLGRPYSMGGVGSPAFDCSGFTCRVYAESGYPIPRVSRDQAKVGAEVDVDALLPGDLLFFAEPGRRISHVGMYVGNGEMVHASSTRGEVMVANLSARWFRKRLVGARRILTSSTSSTTRPGPAFEDRPVELVEHAEDPLLPMLSRPPRLATPSFGPELPDAYRTSIGLRSALMTEGGVLGVTLVPEGTLTFDAWALTVAVAVPVRFELKESPTVGSFDRAGDYFRFLRHLKLGLDGADLELSFSRFGDHQLAGGFLVERLAPGVVSSGVTGLSVETSPLTFYGRARTGWADPELLVDDVFDPELFGGAVTVPLRVAPLEVAAAFVSDQSDRAINAIETDVRYRPFEDRTFSVEVALLGAATRALGRTGWGGSLQVEGEWRFGGFDRSLSMALEASWLGPRTLLGLFGPTYPIARAAHLEAISSTESRPVLGGEMALRLSRWTIGATFSSGVGANRAAFDQVVEGLIELRDLEITRARFLDLRLVYSARALFRDEPRADVIHGTARFRWASWFFTELYFKKGETYEGGGGLTITWMP